MPADAPQPPPQYLEPYLEAVDRHGATFPATLWNSREWQERRFLAIASMADLRDAVILDCGCGLADLADWLTRQGVAYARYIGLEAVPKMADAARARALPRAEILPIDFIADAGAYSRAAHDSGGDSGGKSGGDSGGADTIIFSGSLNTMDDAPALAALERAWRALTDSARERPLHTSDAARLARPRRLIFNFLSERSDKPRGPNPADPSRRRCPATLLEWALERTPLVAFRSDYLPRGHDATIVMTVAR